MAYRHLIMFRFIGCVAVRSNHLCGVWRFGESNEPRLLQVVDTKEVATCINVRLVIIRVYEVTSLDGGLIPSAP